MPFHQNAEIWQPFGAPGCLATHLGCNLLTAARSSCRAYTFRQVYGQLKGSFPIMGAYADEFPLLGAVGLCVVETAGNGMYTARSQLHYLPTSTWKDCSF